MTTNANNELLEHLQDERNFTPVDSFVQFISETDAGTLWVLSKVLQSTPTDLIHKESPTLADRMRKMRNAVIKEYADRYSG